MPRELLLDGAIGGSAARRIVAIAGGEIGDADAVFAVDPEARADAISVAGMADHPPFGVEQVVAADVAASGQILHREAIFAIEAASAVAIPAVARPLAPPHRPDARFGEEAAPLVH